jgi:hypothetical protein
VAFREVMENPKIMCESCEIIETQVESFENHNEKQNVQKIKVASAAEVK